MSKDANIVIHVAGFDSESPRRRQLDAERMLGKVFGNEDEPPAAYPTSQAETTKAIGAGSWSAGVVLGETSGSLVPVFGGQTLVAGHDPAYSNCVTFTATTQPTEQEWPHCARENWDARHDALVDKLTKECTEILGTPYMVFIERDMSTRMLDMVIHCEECGHEQQGSVPEYTAQNDWADVLLRNLIDAWTEADVCQCVDGMTEERILQRYSYLQRCDTWAAGYRASHELMALTPRQIETARTAWSTALRERQKEAREKERVAIVCERDEDGL